MMVDTGGYVAPLYNALWFPNPFSCLLFPVPQISLLWFPFFFFFFLCVFQRLPLLLMIHQSITLLRNKSLMMVSPLPMHMTFFATLCLKRQTQKVARLPVLICCCWFRYSQLYLESDHLQIKLLPLEIQNWLCPETERPQRTVKFFTMALPVKSF